LLIKFLKELMHVGKPFVNRPGRFQHELADLDQFRKLVF